MESTRKVIGPNDIIINVNTGKIKIEEQVDVKPIVAVSQESTSHDELSTCNPPGQNCVQMETEERDEQSTAGDDEQEVQVVKEEVDIPMDSDDTGIVSNRELEEEEINDEQYMTGNYDEQETRVVREEVDLQMDCNDDDPGVPADTAGGRWVHTSSECPHCKENNLIIQKLNEENEKLIEENRQLKIDLSRQNEEGLAASLSGSGSSRVAPPIDSLAVSHPDENGSEILDNETPLFPLVFSLLFKDLEKKDVLNCRVVCSKWKMAVDNFLEDHSSQRPEDAATSLQNTMDYRYCSLSEKKMDHMVFFVGIPTESRRKVGKAQEFQNRGIMGNPKFVGRFVLFYHC